MSDLPAGWLRDEGTWIIVVPIALKQSQLKRVCKQLLDIQRGRLIGMMPGPMMDDLKASMAALQAGKLAQVIEGNDKAIFQSTERINKDRTFFI